VCHSLDTVVGAHWIPLLRCVFVIEIVKLYTLGRSGSLNLGELVTPSHDYPFSATNNIFRVQTCNERHKQQCKCVVPAFHAGYMLLGRALDRANPVSHDVMGTSSRDLNMLPMVDLVCQYVYINLE
jgi:hypothetical protein